MKFVVGHLANNSAEKGTVDLLRAAEMAGVGRRFRVVLAGPGDAELPGLLEDVPVPRLTSRDSGYFPISKSATSSPGSIVRAPVAVRFVRAGAARSVGERQAQRGLPRRRARRIDTARLDGLLARWPGDVEELAAQLIELVDDACCATRWAGGTRADRPSSAGGTSWNWLNERFAVRHLRLEDHEVDVSVRA